MHGRAATNSVGLGVIAITAQVLSGILAAGAVLAAGVWILIRIHKETYYDKRRLELALAGSKVGLWDWSVQGGFVVRSKSYGEMLGYEPAELTDRLLWETTLIHPEDLPRLKAALDSYLAGDSPSFEQEFRLRDAAGRWRWVLDRGVVVARDRHKRPTRAVGITVDITARKEVELRLRELSFRDPVTGLYNRTYFNHKLQELDREEALPLSVIMADLNFLKLANDTFGHRCGDLLLSAAAKVFKENCRASDIVTRWGGDEFAILLPNTGEEEALRICQRIRAACARTHKDPVQLSVALGAATRTSMAEPMDSIVAAAEGWMYRYKSLERGDDTSRWLALIDRAFLQ